jgi:uncharacterized membrane protein SirB2
LNWNKETVCNRHALGTRGARIAAGHTPPMDYPTLKALHQGFATLSFAGFLARGAASLSGAGWVRSRPARILPHVVDTALLASALGLAFTLRVDPVHTPWLAAKIAGLVAYILLGIVALRPGRPVGVRAAAWVSALAVFAWIVSVAVTKQPSGFLSRLG